MSSPSSRMRPADGRSTPVSRLITVVLPAPFGPIRAWRAPFSTLSETPLTAAMPPKCFSRSTVSSATGMSRFPRQESYARRTCSADHVGDARIEQVEPAADVTVAEADDEEDDRAFEERQPQPITDGEHGDGYGGSIEAPEQHQQDEQQADPVLPILRVEGRERVLDQFERHGADQPAVEIAGAADDQDEQEVGRALEREHVERGESGGLRQQRAGDTRIERGEGVNCDEPRIDRDAD